jgi:XTP/dITP diphosphohydrolase
MKRLVIASHNRGKAREIRELLGDVPFEIVALDSFTDVEAPEETEDTYAGNAILKARYYAAALKETVLADDSGLEVNALGGRPGVLSARYAGPDGSDKSRREKLLRELSLVPSENRQARFVCAAAVVSMNLELLTLSEGICEGVITFEEKGSSGFGYDPLFLPNGYDMTFGELSEAVKNRISHRANALEKVREFLTSKNWAA